MRRLFVVFVGAVALITGACTTSGGGGHGGVINHAPVAHLGATPTHGDAPLTVHFNSTASTDDHGITAYSWDFGDNTAVDTSANPTHVYTAAGSYLAQLTVTDAGGLTATDTQLIAVTSAAVNLPPVAHAAATPTTGKAPLDVAFSSDGSSDPDGTIATYSWDFGDGSAVDNTPNPSHTYATVGPFVATLTVTDNQGTPNSATVLVTTVANVAPTAHAAGTPTSGKAPLDVAFSSAGSVDSDGTITTYSWDFGDGSPLETSANPSHTYAAAGDYTATLTVTDDSGDTDSATVSVHAAANLAPTAMAAGTPTSGKAPLDVAFSSAGSVDSDGTIASYSWDFGDGSPLDTSANPSHTYAAGDYTATLTVTDDMGASNSATVAVHAAANQAPTAIANGTPGSGKAPLTVSFSSDGSVDSDGTIASYSWNFGDGSPLDSSANPSHTYTTPSSYIAVLTVTDNDGATDQGFVAVNVGNPNVPPVAQAAATPSSGKAPLHVALSSGGSSDSDGTIVGYSWDFGDGSAVDTSANPSHTYAAGTYTAKLTVTDDDGAMNTVPVTITSNANVAPTAQAAATPSSGKAPLHVALSSSGSTDSDGTIVGYSWDFGDGSALDSSANPSHTYAAAGTYTAKLTVTDDDGASNSTTVSITAVANVAPTAHASGTPTSGKTPLTVSFSSSGSTDSDGTITGYSWDFGDGSSLDTSANPSHTYATAGTYTAKLTVTDDDGATDSGTVSVHVADNLPPTAVAAATPASGPAPLAVSLSSTGSVDPDGTIASYDWDFGDSSPHASTGSATHTYTAAGVYTATLKVTDDNGATGTATATVTVTDPFIYVRNGGDDSAAGTKAAPKATITAALNAAQAAGDAAVRVAGGSYGSFTTVNGVSVIGGYDQSFVAGGSNGSTTVAVSGSGAAATANGGTATLKNLTLTGGAGTGVLVQSASNITFDTDTITSGTPSGAGSSAYGVQVLGSSTVSFLGSSINAAAGVAGTNGTAGSATPTGGGAGATGVAGANAPGTKPSAAAGGSTSGAGGNGGNGGIGGWNAGSCNCAGQSSTPSTGVAGTQLTGGGAGGAGGATGIYLNANDGGGGHLGTGGTAGPAGTAGIAGTLSYGATFSAGTGGAGGSGGAGGGGGGGGGGAAGCTGNSCSGPWWSGGGGGAGGQGGAGGAAGTGGTGGGGSFGIYANNSTVTVDAASTITTHAGGTGGNGGSGHAGAAGGAGGTAGKGGPTANNTYTGGVAGGAGNPGANGGNGTDGTNGTSGSSVGGSGQGGGGGGGGGGGTGGAGGGGAGGSSVAVLHSGTGSATSTGATLTFGSGGTGGTGGNTGAAGASAATLNV
jgi:PKD repeat protein